MTTISEPITAHAPNSKRAVSHARLAVETYIDLLGVNATYQATGRQLTYQVTGERPKDVHSYLTGAFSTLHMVS